MTSSEEQQCCFCRASKVGTQIAKRPFFTRKAAVSFNGPDPLSPGPGAPASCDDARTGTFPDDHKYCYNMIAGVKSKFLELMSQ